jgi:hypothetical protein
LELGRIWVSVRVIRTRVGWLGLVRVRKFGGFGLIISVVCVKLCQDNWWLLCPLAFKCGSLQLAD